jgi:membrane associated rhomboid family serine protease
MIPPKDIGRYNKPTAVFRRELVKSAGSGAKLMLIPLGHEKTSVRRLPWVTFVVMGLCLITFLFTHPGEKARMERAYEDLAEAFEYFGEHPYLELDPRLQNFLTQEFGSDGATSLIEMMRQTGPEPPTDPDLMQREQETLDGLVVKFSSSVDSSPLRILGVVPANIHVPTFITYQFAHLGWGHLLGNLFILFLAGPFIEDVWGRPLYATFYLAAGIVAALMFVARYPDFDAPLVGASGAIAGVMGAFLIRYWNTKIKFFYWIFFFLVGTFEAPAWLMLPLWFLKELVFAQAMDTVTAGEGGGGVAFWAHVWGFVFGVVVASAVAYFRIEERFIHRSIESKVTLVDNTAVEDAATLAEGGDRDGAKAALKHELAAHPENLDAAISLWNLCFHDGDVAASMPHMLSAIGHAVRTGDTHLVTTHWPEVLDSGCAVDVDPALGARIAEMLRKEIQIEPATETVDLVARRVDESTPSGIVLRLARLAVDLGSEQASALASIALSHPDLPPEAREELGEVAALAGEVTDGGSEPSTTEDSPEDEPVVYSIAARRVAPRRLDGQILEVEVDGKRHAIDLATVQVIAVCGITRSAQKPVVLVDLFLDSPWGERPRLRVIRMTSNTFDPRHLVGGDEAMVAFQTLLERLLEVSDAVPLPDPDAARGKPFQSFSTIDAYEKEVLGIG